MRALSGSNVKIRRDFRIYGETDIDVATRRRDRFVPTLVTGGQKSGSELKTKPRRTGL
jgi:hypothetical protein